MCRCEGQTMGKAAVARSLHYFDVIIIFQKNEEPDINKNACASGRSIYLSDAAAWCKTTQE